MVPIYNYLVISALGIYRPGIVSEIARACRTCGCNLLSSKMNVLGEDIAAFLFVSGNWGAIAKMEAALPSLSKRLALSIQSRRTTESLPNKPALTYSVQILAVDRGGILNEVSDFLNKQSVLMEEISAQTYTNSASTKMLNLQLRVQIPSNVHLASIREKLMSYCDDQNFECFLEPIRH